MFSNVLTCGRKAFALTVSWVGFIEHEYILSYLSAELEKLSNETKGNLCELSESLNSFADIVLDNHIALDYILAAEGAFCAIMNTTYCTYINNSAKLETRVEEILKQATWLKN